MDDSYNGFIHNFLYFHVCSKLLLILVYVLRWKIILRVQNEKKNQVGKYVNYDTISNIF